MLRRPDLDTFLLMANAGWQIDTVMRIMVNSMNGLGNAATAEAITPFEAPDHREFRRATELFGLALWQVA